MHHRAQQTHLGIYWERLEIREQSKRKCGVEEGERKKRNMWAELKWEVLLGKGKLMGKGREEGEDNREKGGGGRRKRQRSRKSPVWPFRGTEGKRPGVGGAYFKGKACACTQSHTQQLNAWSRDVCSISGPLVRLGVCLNARGPLRGGARIMLES